MSTHSVPVVRIESVEAHPNADNLGVVQVFGYTCCVNKADFKPGDLAVYIEPDYVVPPTPEFAFLGDNRRIRVRRLRGVLSQGLLLRAPAGAQEGDDMMSALGITRYEPPESLSTGGDNETPPRGHFPVFDVESLRRYPNIFQPGEPVVVSEKIHGCNARYVFHEGRMYCGSRTGWKRESDTSVWWKALRNTPALALFCADHPDTCVYGEVFGQVQDLKYGARAGAIFFAGFDILSAGIWLNAGEAQQAATSAGIPWVPQLISAPYNRDVIECLSSGPSLWWSASHMREGCVVRPALERTDPTIGRVILKVVSNEYLGRK